MEPPKVLILDLSDIVKMELVLVRPGTFEMGSPDNEADRLDNEKQHMVSISKYFYIGRYAVTQEQYELVTGKNPSKYKGFGNPVDGVSWDDAKAFCNLLQNRLLVKIPTGTEIQLPTEAQWEYACRAGSSNKYYSGEDVTDLDNVAWYRWNSQLTTHPVGQKRPNALGLYDMLGNVYHWCQDTYPNDSSKLSVVNPCNFASDSFHVLRGGSALSLPKYCRSASRIFFSPAPRDNIYGFRIVITSHNKVTSEIPPF